MNTGMAAKTACFFSGMPLGCLPKLKNLGMTRPAGTRVPGCVPDKSQDRTASSQENKKGQSAHDEPEWTFKSSSRHLFFTFCFSYFSR
jgi:hypothetical protein